MVRAAIVILMALAIGVHAQQSATALSYQGRGAYKEGIRAAPSTSPASLDLISATIDYQEPYTTLPQYFRALFYLNKADMVNLVVREVRPQYFYWLDEVRPASGWVAGKANRFEWSTSTVMLELDRRDPRLQLKDLGAVARLGGAAPGKLEVVAPVLLYHTQLPAVIEGYRFVFRPDARVRLGFKMFAGDSANEVDAPQNFPSVLPLEPHTVRFRSDKWADGWYRLEASGYDLSNNNPVNAIVRFYHTRRLAN